MGVRLERLGTKKPRCWPDFRDSNFKPQPGCEWGGVRA